MLNDLKLTAADQLGSLLAEIKTLEARADAIKTQIKEAASAGGPRVIEGVLFKATYSESNRATVDYKAIVMLLADLILQQNPQVDIKNVISNMVAENTKVSAVFAVKVTSR
jgi:predicted trehalose synthase